MEKRRTRTANPCDGCSLRRVRCRMQGSPPCVECQKHSRGPKGPRQCTSEKVVHYQNEIRQSQTLFPTSQNLASSVIMNESDQIPLGLYLEYLDKFRECLTCVWPILNVEDLKARLVQNSLGDHNAWALAGAVCATVIAQLRLSQIRLAKQDTTTTNLSSLADSFARHAQRLRDRFIYRQNFSTESLLTAFFLHVYFTITGQTRTAIMYLHETIAQLHLQDLHLAETLANLADEQKELALRIYWLVFVSEKTFCVQNCFPTSLSPIQALPSSEYHIQGVGHLDPSFQLLTQLFTLLDNNIIMAGNRRGACMDASSLDHLQYALSAMDNIAAVAPRLPETQRVNVLMTGNWINILCWQYALRHIQMSSRRDADATFSILEPASVAEKAMRLFASVSRESITTHGFGMELKVFRITDALVDLLACNRYLLDSTRPNNGRMVVGPRDTLYALQNTLHLIGGPESLLYKRLLRMMAEVALPVPQVPEIIYRNNDARKEENHNEE
ncbi:AflYd/sugR/sugar regulator [Colletotrichum orchidophilum]|uniref:AflYd/sugR/sugar regulator n=1 Tax=Colletotrichum orchidophilum TaxID=1209926 RepID=A0A1G4BT81_9PEZI|nr:AflYd/sugR/sugar regulator [Colletotrichum orchidophilum]OHF04545.1 AflYd/sugR/sugar regulator [Colletotrichum orchidophilum]